MLYITLVFLGATLPPYYDSKVLWKWYLRYPDQKFPNTFQTCMNLHKPLKILLFDFWSIFSRFKNNANNYDSLLSLIMLLEQFNIFQCQSVAHLNLVLNPFLILPIIIRCTSMERHFYCFKLSFWIYIYKI